MHDGGWGRRELIIRVNSIDSPWGAADLAAVAAAGPDAVLVPKVSTPDDLLAYNEALAGAPPATRLWAMIETCSVLPELNRLAALKAGTRLAAFVLGTNDLAKDMRAQIKPGRAPFLPITAAASALSRRA